MNNNPALTGDFDLWAGQSPLDMVADFHQVFGHPIATDIIDIEMLRSDHVEHRLDFIQSELDEAWQARQTGDVVGFADAMGDLLYFVLGTFLSTGIPAEPVFSAIHDANMDKRQPDGSVAYDATTFKVLKPEGWVGPEARIEAILIEAETPFDLAG